MDIYINGRFLTQSITGVQRYAHELVKALDNLVDRGDIDQTLFRFKLLVPGKGCLYNLRLKNIMVQRVGYLSGHYWEQLELPIYVRGGLLFCPGNTAPMLSLLSKQLTVTTVHSLSYLYFPEAYSFAFRAFYRIIIPLVFRFSEAIITVSHSEKKSILKRYTYVKSRLHAIQNGAISNDFLSNDGIKKTHDNSLETIHPFVLFVGSLSKCKNIQGVLGAVAILNKKNNVHLVIAGAKEKIFKSLQFVMLDNISQKIHFKGQINDSYDLIHFYKTASCLIFPSFYESSGLPPIEAMAYGCPVIASSIPSLQERCGDAAYYVDPHSGESIAEGIYKVLTDNDLRSALIKKGLGRAKLFSWERSAKEHLKVFEEVLNR